MRLAWVLFFVSVAGAYPDYAPPFLLENNTETKAVYLQRGAYLVSSDGSTFICRKRINGGAWSQVTASATGGLLSAFSEQVQGWSGLTPATSPLTFLTGAGATVRTIEFSLLDDGTPDGSVVLELPAVEATVSYAAGVSGWQTINLPVVVVTVTPEGEFTVTDSLADPPPDEKVTGPGVMVFDSRMPGEVDVWFGDELLELKPGYNAFPFNGELDETGEWPQALFDSGISAARVVGEDGVTYWLARLQPTIEGAPTWASDVSIPFEWLPSATAGTGPTLKIPGSLQGSHDYLQVPLGVVPGNNVALPGGMTPGTAGLPAGVPPGEVAALPSGVISGGADYLPPGVSPGVVPPPSAGGSGATAASGGGATGAGAGSVNSDPTEAYSPGPDAAGFEAEARLAGESWSGAMAEEFGAGVDAIGESAKGVFGETGFKFWTGASPISGADSSWMNFDLPIADITASITVPPDIIALIRAILLWGVKIWFVVSVIRLFLK